LVEDQQRINSFSKLNARIKLIEQKLEGLRVSVIIPFIERDADVFL
jgi:hypothetical protein